MAGIEPALYSFADYTLYQHWVHAHLRRAMELNHHRYYTEHLSRMPQQTIICLLSIIVRDTGFEPVVFLMYQIYSLALHHHRSRSPAIKKPPEINPGGLLYLSKFKVILQSHRGSTWYLHTNCTNYNMTFVFSLQSKSILLF